MKTHDEEARLILAGLAMQGLLASTANLDEYPDAEPLAQQAVKQADALLAELKRTEKE